MSREALACREREVKSAYEVTSLNTMEKKKAYPAL
jgi:hypothetical protein